MDLPTTHHLKKPTRSTNYIPSDTFNTLKTFRDKGRGQTTDLKVKGSIFMLDHLFLNHYNVFYHFDVL